MKKFIPLFVLASMFLIACTPQVVVDDNTIVKDDVMADEDADSDVEESGGTKEIALAKCLTEKGAKLFTASWCGHCTAQKEAFGAGLEFLDNTECAEDKGWAQVCEDAGIESVPTWVFGNGTKQSGNTDLAKLAKLGGCEY